MFDCKTVDKTQIIKCRCVILENNSRKMSFYWNKICLVYWIYVALILNLDKEVIGMSCLLSFELMRKVNQCPRNKDEWNVRADMFNCSSINQTCVQTDMFQYHCVLNSNGTELLETCAPIKYIYGQNCAEFDAKGKIIQESSKNCTNASVPCPKFYKSTDAYRYQSCYDGVQMKKEKKEAVNCKFDSLDSTLIIIVVVLNIILFLMAGLIFYSWKKYTNTSIYFRSRKSKPSRNPSTCSTKEHECIEIFTELN